MCFFRFGIVFFQNSKTHLLLKMQLNAMLLRRISTTGVFRFRNFVQFRREVWFEKNIFHVCGKAFGSPGPLPYLPPGPQTYWAGVARWCDIYLLAKLVGYILDHLRFSEE